MIRKLFQWHKFLKNLQLRTILILLFIFPVFISTGLVGWLSFRNGQKAVNNLIKRLQKEVESRIDQHLDSYLEIPKKLATINTNAIESGLLNPRDLVDQGRFYCQFWSRITIHNY